MVEPTAQWNASPQTYHHKLKQECLQGMQARPEANQYFDILAQVSQAINASAGNKATVQERG